jgi:DNA-binding CsgD family transcriptional regulator
LFGVHIAAAYRLRTALSGPPDGDAVLRPDGSVVHAERDARPKHARQRLRDYAVAVERARGRLRARAPEEAVELWTGLTAGMWSLVDRFDRDGKRYLIARKNTPDALPLFSLTPREAQVVGYAVLGHSNKSIAYALGISQSRVSATEHSAMLKLGVRSRAELVRLRWRRHPQPPLDDLTSITGACIGR